MWLSATWLRWAPCAAAYALDFEPDLGLRVIPELGQHPPVLKHAIVSLAAQLHVPLLVDKELRVLVAPPVVRGGAMHSVQCAQTPVQRRQPRTRPTSPAIRWLQSCDREKQ